MAGLSLSCVGAALNQLNTVPSKQSYPARKSVFFLRNTGADDWLGAPAIGTFTRMIVSSGQTPYSG
jgi:hypothetical protein